MKDNQLKFAAILALGFPLGSLAEDPEGESKEHPSPAPGTILSFAERIPHRDGKLIDAERSMVFVPMNRSNSKSGVIAIEVYRFKSDGGEDAKSESVIPPVFRLNGGPGYRGLADDLKNPRFIERVVWPITRGIGADFVVVGQRGIGSSKPDTLIEPIAPFPPGRDVTPEEYAQAVRAACERGKKFWETERELDLDGFTVIEAAADVNDVCQAFGYEKIIVSGGSFGSHWGMAVMRFHPEIVERAVLSSLEGPDHTWDMPGHVLHSLERIAAAAEQDSKLAEHLPEGGLIAALREVIGRLEKAPVVVDDVKHPESGRSYSVRIDARLARSLALGVTERVNSRGGIPDWPADILALHRGEYQEAARAVLRMQGPHRRTASFFLLDCGSGISRGRKKELDADPATAVLGDINALYRAATPVWGIDLGDGFRKNFDTEIPTLLVHGTWDVSTPLENARELAPHFKKGKLVFVKGGSHGALMEAKHYSRAFKNGWIQFIRTGDLSAVPDEVSLPPIRWKTPN